MPLTKEEHVTEVNFTLSFGSLWKWVVIWLAIWVALQITWTYGPFMRDATDGKYGRSGVNLRIDAETGLHYLEGTRGGLTPRLTKDGMHMQSDYQRLRTE